MGREEDRGGGKRGESRGEREGEVGEGGRHRLGVGGQKRGGDEVGEEERRKGGCCEVLSLERKGRDRWVGRLKRGACGPFGA